jgi:WD40 repeat protein
MADSRVTFLHEFNDHQSVVNAARFSPCGRMLATASDRLVIVYEC